VVTPIDILNYLWGYSISPYLMQRTIFKMLQTMIEGLKLKLFIYLDDILLIGRPKVLYKAVQMLKDSSFNLNGAKSVYVPTRRINYLGLRIDSKSSRLRLTSAAIATIKNSIVHFSHKVMTTKDWERWAGLINLYAIALRLPFFLVQLAYLRNRFSLYLAALMTTGYVSYFDYFYQIVTVDAGPTGIGMSGIGKSLAMPVYLQQYYAEWLAAFGAIICCRTWQWPGITYQHWSRCRGVRYQIIAILPHCPLGFLLDYFRYYVPSMMIYVPSSINCADVISRAFM
jgi:hypothetical protein